MASSMTWEEAKERLRKLREENARKSEEVVEIFEESIFDSRHKLGDELWIIHEQVCVAACDCNRVDVAELCLGELSKQFSNSLRVKRLKGLLFESQERYEDAVKLYDEILEADETNSLVRKRKIAMLKAQNMIPDAIKELSKYIEKFMSDYEAWMELCDLYIMEQEYAKAAYCMEEIIISNPHNHLYHQKYAEIRYTQGSQENMETARKYFSQSLKSNPSNVRSLFGLFMSASNLASSTKSNAKAKRENIKYAAWAAEQITERYTGKLEPQPDRDPSSQLQAITSMLDTLQITQSTT